jgi:rubrerythrin
LKALNPSHLNPWDLDAILPLDYELEKSVDQTLINRFCELLSRDVYSEGDAQGFYNYLHHRDRQSNNLDSWQLSDSLKQVLPRWLADECQHYRALRRVYQIVSGISETDINYHQHQRRPNLTAIAPVLVDEFTIVATFLFDEAGSMFSYRRDLREFYQPLGKPFARIAQRLVQDEGQHFRWFKQVLLNHYGDRLGELPATLKSIVQLEKSLGCYHGTFLLDHAQEMHRFPPDFSDRLVEWILAGFDECSQ